MLFVSVKELSGAVSSGAVCTDSVVGAVVSGTVSVGSVSVEGSSVVGVVSVGSDGVVFCGVVGCASGVTELVFGSASVNVYSCSLLAELFVVPIVELFSMTVPLGIPHFGVIVTVSPAEPS